MQALQDYFIISIERRYEDQKTKSGIILLNSAYLEEDEMDRFQHKRIYGTIESIPTMYSDTAYRAVDDGMPAYRKFIGHDDIVDKINRGYTRAHDTQTYYPSTFDAYSVVTMADIGKRMNARVGQKVYFMPQATEGDNFLEEKNSLQYYKISASEVFAVIEDGAIRMQGEWVLVKPEMETWEEITTKTGIIKKPNPEAKWLLGSVVASEYDHCMPGTKIVYLPNADCKVKVEDEEYYVMPVQDLIGKLN